MKTTKAQFREFVGECRKWIRVFGLSDWFVRFSHDDEFPMNFATCVGDVYSRDTTIHMTNDIGSSTMDECGGIDLLAFEEVMHLALQDITTYIPPRDKGAARIAEHAFIARMSGVLIPHKKAICG